MPPSPAPVLRCVNDSPRARRQLAGSRYYMEAANRGASEARGVNVGLTISIPIEEFDNRYVTRELSFHFHYFFMRKFWFAYLAKALPVFPGGFGTLDELFATLETIAKDVKIQIEFNPATVAEYRLVGYENRALRRVDFNNDKVDAGDIGAWHTVTALYEITLAGSKGQKIDPLRYCADKTPAGNKDEIALLCLRDMLPGNDTSKLIEQPLKTAEIKDTAKTSADFRFAAAVAAFGQQLRGGKYTGALGYDEILVLAQSARVPDVFGYRGEFVTQVNLAKSLDRSNRQVQR